MPVYSIALVLLALIALIFVAAALPIESLSELRLRNLSWWVVPVIAVLHIMYLLLSAEVWRRMVRVIGGVRTAFGEAYLQMVAVSIGKYIPGKVWGFIARTGQLHRHNISTHLSVVSTVVEQILVLAGGGIVIVAAGFVVFPEYKSSIISLGALLLVGLIMVSKNIPAVVRWFGSRQSAIDVPANVGGSDLPGLLRFGATYAMLWMLSGLIFSIIYFSLFDAAVTAENIAALVLANTIGFIVGFFAVFAPGGLGIREATTVAVLAPFLPIREVLVATIALRAWIVLFDGINAVIMLISESRRAAKGLR